ncbi:MAG: hypothetical protein COA78_19645 [Blastopirellula sp.]|nr:MAG: hypothetical protein COA78_19645 [Blastopirellula sp.]
MSIDNAKPRIGFQNTILGGNFLLLAILGMIASSPAERVAIPRICVTALHITIALLFLVRRPSSRIANWKELAICFPSFILAAFAWKLAHDSDSWSTATQIMLLSGTLFTIYSLAYLGNSFAIFPAQREIKVQGPYRLVRHPVYLGELIMILACCISTGRLLAVAVFLAAVVSVAIRLIAEERFLIASEDYQQYRLKVRWRLLPILW